VVITGSRNRFLYVPPANTNEPAEKVRSLCRTGANYAAKVWNLLVGQPLCGNFGVSVEMDLAYTQRFPHMFRILYCVYYAMLIVQLGFICFVPVNFRAVGNIHVHG
jgi:hypothetical protein